MAKRAVKAGPQLRIRVDLAAGCSVGPGKISLLDAIEREGSLSVAARSIGLSYRRAWNLLTDLNQSFVKPVAATRLRRFTPGKAANAKVSEHRRVSTALGGARKNR